jgi:hypothetical protein
MEGRGGGLYKTCGCIWARHDGVWGRGGIVNLISTQWMDFSG